MVASCFASVDFSLAIVVSKSFRVGAAGGVVKECLKTGGCIAVGGGVVKERLVTGGRVVSAPVVLLRSALAPPAVLKLPVVFHRVRTDR